MKHIVILIFYLFIAFIIFSCKTNEINSRKAVIGKVTVEFWMEKSGWSNEFFNNTEFSKSDIDEFVKLTQNKEFFIFASSTCNECSQSLPYFFKLIQSSKISEKFINLYGLDDYWEEPSGIHKKFKISELPQIIIQNKEKKITLSKSEFTDIKSILKQLRDNQ